MFAIRKCKRRPVDEVVWMAARARANGGLLRGCFFSLLQDGCSAWFPDPLGIVGRQTHADQGVSVPGVGGCHGSCPHNRWIIANKFASGQRFGANLGTTGGPKDET